MIYINKKCKYCNCLFKTNKSNKSYEHFCSIECEIKFINSLNIINSTCMIKLCEICNKPFISFKKEAKFCSSKCKRINKHNNNQIVLICKGCNCEFSTFNRKQKYCSIYCGSKESVKLTNFGTKIRPNKTWNKGLTAQTNKTIEKMAQNQTVTLLNAYKNGTIKSISKYDDEKYNNTSHTVRSSWELNFAKILMYLNRKYEYEPTPFLLSNNRYYIPDFYDYKNNCYYEIKGRWYEQGKEKFNLFIKEYPQIRIKLIDKKKYKRIICFFKKNIEFINNKTLKK